MDYVLTICDDVILHRNVLGAATTAVADQLIPTRSLSANFFHGWRNIEFFFLQSFLILLGFTLRLSILTVSIFCFRNFSLYLNFHTRVHQVTFDNLL